MKLSEIVSEELVLPSLKGTDTASVLREFADAVSSAGKYPDAGLLFERLYDREKQESTGIGNGIAIPHCKIENLQQIFLAVGYSAEGVQFKAIDHQPTYFFFLIVSPASASVLHLRMLAALSRLLRSPHFMTALKQRPEKAALIDLIRIEEEDARVAP